MTKALSLFTLEPSAMLDNYPSPNNSNPGGFIFTMTQIVLLQTVGKQDLDRFLGKRLQCAQSRVISNLRHIGEGLGI